jgi:hypothetical protein
MSKPNLGQPVGQTWDNVVPQHENPQKPVGQLKSLAFKVLNGNVPLSHPLGPGTVGQAPEKRDSVWDKRGTTAQETNLRHDAEDSWEWIVERSAIIECEAGLGRAEADYKAFMLWYHTFVEGKASK